MWWAFANAVVSSMAAEKAAKAQMDAMNLGMTGMHRLQIGRPHLPKPSKCPGCGSHSFIDRGPHKVCTYCRSEQ